MHRYLRYALRAGLVLGIVVVVFLGWHGIRLWLAWQSFDHFEFDPEASRSRLPPISATLPPADDPVTDDPGAPAVEVAFMADPSLVDVFLLVGSDEDKGKIESLRADAILLFLWPKDGSGPLLTSLPRDLYITNPCTGAPARLSVTLEGCGDEINGPELLALTVEDFTGLTIDHFAVLSFGGFKRIIDRLGGVQMCVPRPLMLGTALEMPAGCSVLDGKEALVWLRERAAFELVDGEWQAAGAGDLARTERQQDLLLELLRRLRAFRSPLQLSSMVGDLADAFLLDDALDLPEAVDIAWDLRRVSPVDIHRGAIAVENGVTDDGEFVRLPAEPFGALITGTYG